MNCAWNEFMALIPARYKPEVDKHSDTLQELRLRMGQRPELITARGSSFLKEPVGEEDLRFAVNAASRYSPWAAASAAQGYITAPGGHRLGLCGNMTPTGVSNLRSVNIRVARDFPGLADKLPADGNILILGPPGSGKTTLLRDLIRKISSQCPVSVVDEREELFPVGFDRGVRTDVLSGCCKPEAIQMLLRAMAPAVIALDEVTAEADCRALEATQWCGVRLVATAHAANREDLHRRSIYRPLAQCGCFDTLVILKRDKSWHWERMAL